MKLFFIGMLAAALGLFLAITWALENEWVPDVEVTQLGAYQASAAHFVWFGSLAQECKNSPAMYYDKARSGVRLCLMATLLAALVNKRKTDYQAAGCDIVEAYLR
ncbi:hypothetical protein [Xanthomonas sp. BRIP62415]|uniref:hypothetical protein n=1 Tax=Xanthomonas sp. BRIP62415 TaxID=2182390 RepID=UPI000F8C627E|nr:hypothetical protein [Xanthomonas sp. BRIP62415]